MQQVGMAKSIKNDAWISNEDISNPDVLPDLPGYHILVRPVSIKEKTKGGILLPDSTRDDMAYLTTVGQVVALFFFSFIHFFNYIFHNINRPFNTLNTTY